MFDVGASELLLIAVVAIVVIGPKDMPRALRTAGRWVAKIRRVSGHFRSGIEAMIREAEMEELERKWREQNEQIMAAHPDAGPPGAAHFDAGHSDSGMPQDGDGASFAGASAEARGTLAPAAGPSASERAPEEQGQAETRAVPIPETAPPARASDEPQLPLGGPVTRQEP